MEQKGPTNQQMEQTDDVNDHESDDHDTADLSYLRSMQRTKQMTKRMEQKDDVSDRESDDHDMADLSYLQSMQQMSKQMEQMTKQMGQMNEKLTFIESHILNLSHGLPEHEPMSARSPELWL